jgi:GT2 family glycosyltransferase
VSARDDTGSRTVHVLILNWNGWQDTVECLESVLQLQYSPLRVIVCDNGSTDGSMDHIREWARGNERAVVSASPLGSPVRPDPRPVAFVEFDRTTAEAGIVPNTDVPLVLIQNGANLGFAGGNNVGLRYLLESGASGMVCLLNNDMVVATDSVSHLARALEESPGIGCVGPTLLEYRQPNLVQAAAGGAVYRWQGLPRPHSASGQPRGSHAALHPDRLDFIGMGCMMLPMAVVRRVGLIDERFFLYCEDIDYSLRILDEDLHLGFVAKAEVWHKGGSSSVHGSAFHDYHMIRSSLLLVRKFAPDALPAALAYSVARCVTPKLLRGEWGRLAATVRAYRDSL